MKFTEELKNRLKIKGELNQQAAEYPGPEAFPYGIDLQAELKRVCDWLVEEQKDDGLWHSADGRFYFYSDAYAIRSLLAASEILDENSYLPAADKWVDYIIDNQRPDGGFWTGYPAADKPEDKTTAYLADGGEIGMALIAAYSMAKKNGDSQRSEKILNSLLSFLGFIDQFRWRDGGMGVGYYRPNKLTGNIQPRAKCGLYLFATVAAGVAFQSGLYSITKDEKIWRHTLNSLDCCLEHTHPWPKTLFSMKHDMEPLLDFRLLYRCMDAAFKCSPESMEEFELNESAPGLRFKSQERQKIYAAWKHCMQLLAESQVETGEWFGPYDDDEHLEYKYPMRHRLYFLYALSNYLQTPGLYREDEDQDLVEARNRQFWLCRNQFLLKEHYGVCVNDPVMPSGVWGMILCEIMKTGSTLPAYSRNI